MENSTIFNDFTFHLDPQQRLKREKNIHSDNPQQNLLRPCVKITSFRIMARTLKLLFTGKTAAMVKYLFFPVQYR